MVAVYVGGLLALFGWSMFLDHKIGSAARGWLVRNSRGQVLRALLLTTALYAVLLVLTFAVTNWAISLAGRDARPLEYVGYVLSLLVLMPPCAAVIPGRSRPFFPLPTALRRDRVPAALAGAIGWPASALGTVGFIVLAVSPLPLLLS
ncbi:hypothetical protein EXU48_00210 [Occultella glacieicola]|uniref:Uncharacterized protein n=1 Tax=Occultella glacieicola TaxID=2518684 RepID=A0ABY2E9R0_9MICO|nr:hypothetical protein [Occultella glacieicola]TDE98680.1 hypothetical protein EXU48_00210 [Occultella glacieicola]